MTGNWAKASKAYRFSCAYDGVTLTSQYMASTAGFDDQVWDGAEVPVIVNTVRRMVNTFVSKSFANDNPAPQMVSTDGTFEQRLAAEAIDETLMAEFELPHGQFSNINELHRHGGTISTCATGQYWVFAFPGDGKVEAELDDGLTLGIVRSGRYGQILTLCRTIWRDPEWLCSRYPGQSAEILAAVETVQSQTRYADNRNSPTPSARNESKMVMRRVVRVHQGWRSQINEDTTGRELFCLKDGTCLEDNVWEHPGPPGRSWEFERELDGEGGVSLTQTVYRLFMRRNEALFDRDRAVHNMPLVGFLCQKGTGESEALNSQIQGATGVAIWEITGNVNSAIKAFEMPNLSQASTDLVNSYGEHMHDVTGIAKAQTSGARQPGTTSGLHESLTASYYTENFADAERRLIQFRAVDCAQLFIWALQKVVENKYSRWVGDAKKRRQLTGDDLDLDDSKYVLGIKPASEEKDSPKARLEKAERLLQDPAGRFTGADLVETWKTFDESHAENKAYRVESSVEGRCSKWLRATPEEMMQPNFYRSPLKWWRKEGLAAALSICSYEYDEAIDQGAPQNKLAYFERFMDECTELIDQEMQREAELAAMAGGAPPPPGASSGGPAATPGAGGASAPA
jgi:hypothetical protein